MLEALPNVTRRWMLGGSVAMGAAAAQAAEPPGAPRLLRRARQWVLAFGSKEWVIDPLAYEGAARVSPEIAPERIRLQLSDASLPGTTTRADFIAEIQQLSGRWWIRMTAPGLGLRAHAPLAAWLSDAAALRSRGQTPSIAFGDHRLSGGAGSVAYTARSEVIYRPQTGVRLHGRVSGRARGLLLAPRAPQRDSVRHDLVHAGARPATHGRLIEPRLDERPLARGVAPGGGRWSFTSSATGDLEMELYRGPKGPAGVLLVSRPGAVEGLRRNGRLDRIPLESAALLLASDDRIEPRTRVAGRIARRAHAIDLPSGHAQLSGHDEAPFLAEFGHRSRPEIAADVRLEQLWLPVGGADHAMAVSDGRLIRVVYAADAKATKAAKAAATCPSTPYPGGDSTPPPVKSMIWLCAGKSPPFSVLATDGLTLKVRRSADLLDLTFQFDGYYLKMGQSGVDPNLGQAVLTRRPETTAPHLAVIFPPQHLAETKYDVQDPRTCYPGGLPFDPYPISQARLSRESRIVFQITSKDALYGDVALDLDTLTEWRDLAMAVHPRAAVDPNANIIDQLKVPNIGPLDSTTVAMGKIAASLTAPTKLQTYLELTSHLLLSPARGRWRTPKSPAGGDWAPLWYAQLEDPDSTLRAIWSRLLQEGVLPDSVADRDIKPPVSLVAKNHWELILQNSVYGLPALRGDTDLAAGAQGPDRRPVPGGVAALPGYAYLDGGYYQSLQPPTPEKPHPERDAPPPPPGAYPRTDVGVAMPTPFQDASIVLTPWGASFVGQWHGDPPLLLTRRDDLGNNHWPRAPDLERLEYWSQLGRDIRVEVVEKGYLLPLGVRASRVKLTERRFFRDPNWPGPKGGSTVAYLVERQFVVARPKKTYPAINQPHDGREFPALALEMLTLKTPDLVNPEKDWPDATNPGAWPVAPWVGPNGRVFLPGFQPDDLVFWPRVQAGVAGQDPGDVEFKWRLDDDEGPVSSNLLFVSNRLMSSPVLGTITDYYNSLVKPAAKQTAPTQIVVTTPPPGATVSPLRIANLAGGRRRYAAGSSSGETSFDTDRWIMGVSGRLADPTSETDTYIYQIDAAMNGHDQPPFYPVVQRAVIDVQSIDHLLGRPNGAVTVSFDQRFRLHGFDKGPGRNPGTLILDVLEPIVEMQPGANGQAVGGLAHTGSYVAALSLETGLVGAQPPKPAPPGACVASPGPFNLDDAQNNVFNADFFNKAQILGLFTIGQVLQLAGGLGLDRAPKLLETVGYGVSEAAGDAARAIAEAIKAIWHLAHDPPKPPPVRKGPLDEAIDGLNAKVTTPLVDITGATLYPELYAALTGFAAALQAAKTAADAVTPSMAVIAPAAGAVAAAARTLLAEMQRLSSDPVPTLVHEEVAKLASYWDSFKAAVDGSYGTLADTVYTKMVKPRLTQICEALKPSGLDEALLGHGLMSCDDILQDPRRLKTLPDILFAETFGDTLGELVWLARELEVEATGALIFQEQALIGQIQDLIAEAGEALRDRVVQPATAVEDNILNAVVQLDIAKAALDRAHAEVEALGQQGAAAPEVILTRLTDFETRLAEKVEASLRARIDAHAAAFPPVSGDAATLIRDFKTAVVGPARAFVTAAIWDSLRQARQDLNLVAGQARAALLLTVVQKLQPVFLKVASQLDFAVIAQLGRQLGQWCTGAAATSAPLLDFADDVAGGLLGDATMASGYVDDMIGAANIALPADAPPSVQQALKRLGAGLRTLRGRIKDDADNLYARRKTLADIRTALQTDPNVCTQIGTILRAVEALIATRDQIAGLVTRAASDAAIVKTWLDNLPPSPAPAPGAPVPPAPPPSSGPLSLLAKRGGLLLRLTTSISEVVKTSPGQSAAWVEAQARLRDLVTKMSAQAGPYAQAVSQAMGDLKAEALRVDTLLKAVTAPLELVDPAKAAQAYATEFERRLLAKALQAIALPDDVSGKLLDAIGGMLDDLLDGFIVLHKGAHDVIYDVDKLLKIDIVKTFVPTQAAAFPAHVKSYQDDYDLLAKARGKADVAEKARLLAPLFAKWGANQSGLVDAATDIAAAVDTILHAPLSKLVPVDTLVSAVRTAVQQAIKELVPTRIDLSYDWSAELKDIDGLFTMPSHSRTDLVLSSHIHADFLDGSREVTAVGTLQPFGLEILGGELATILFDTTRFESKNGGSPHFDMRVTGVTLGSLLTYLQALQSWMSPSGSGFYVKLITDGFSGIEAGYIYDAGIIQVGSLTFLNVSFLVAARLPFDDKGVATISFGLASAERPFLISEPPYGGGGYLKLSGHTAIDTFEVSFVFGGVVGIHFGPLSAQGRIVTGVRDVQGPAGMTLTAIIEAVGEGSIACFSICVYIRLSLTHHASGVMDGEAYYSFTFSIGFAHITYGFTAKYTLSGQSEKSPPDQKTTQIDDGRRYAALVLAPADCADMPKEQRFTVNWTPRKASRWSDYAKHVDVDLTAKTKTKKKVHA